MDFCNEKGDLRLPYTVMKKKYDSWIQLEAINYIYIFIYIYIYT